MALIAALALLAAAEPPVPAGSGRTTWGVGTYSCGKWVEQRQAPKDVLTDMDRLSLSDWLGGFLSGVADSSRVPDLPAAMVWIDNYCQAHPLEKVATAADELIAASQRR